MDTQYFNFTLRENATFWTKKFSAEANTAHNGDIYKITVSPFESMIKAVTASGVTSYHTNSLGITLSRFREIKYIGTRLAIKPLATNGSVDPVHIQQSAASGPDTGNPVDHQGQINPYDSNNYYHARRWIGGNFNIPNMTVGSVEDQLRLDNMWLSDERFIHKNVNEGFETFATPLRASVDMGASGTNTLFGFHEAGSLLSIPGGSSTGNQEAGWIALGAGEVHEEGWVPNPMAGFIYKTSNTAGEPAGGEDYIISAINDHFPWFADVLVTEGSNYTVTKMVELVKERFMQPIAIMRFPAAYGTYYGWRMYLSHEFSARKPYIINSAWIAGKVTEEIPGTIIRTQLDLDGRERPIFEMKEKDLNLLSALPCDPYAVDDVPNTITMESGMKYLGNWWHYHPEPRSPVETKVAGQETPDSPESK